MSKQQDVRFIDPRILAILTADMPSGIKLSMIRRNAGKDDRVSWLSFWKYKKIEKREDEMDKVWFKVLRGYITMCASIRLSPMHSLEQALDIIGKQLDELAYRKVQAETLLKDDEDWLRDCSGISGNAASQESRERMDRLRRTIRVRERNIKELGDEIDFMGKTAHEIFGTHFPWDRHSRDQIFNVAKARWETVKHYRFDS